MKNHVEEYAKRAERHENIDGVGELNGGVGMLGMAAYWWFSLTTPSGSVWHRWYTVYAFLGLFCLALYLGTKAIRTHITYLRTGYAKPRQDRIPWLYFALACLLLTAAFVVGQRHVIASVMLLAMMWPLGYAYWVARVDGRKWPVVGIMVLGAVAISMIPADIVRSTTGLNAAARLASVSDIFAYLWLSFTFIAVTTVVSGGLTLYRYVRHTRPPASGTE